MKDSPGRPDEPLPARRVAVPPPAAPPPAGYGDDDAEGLPAPGPRRASARLLWRAFRRHWWFALPLWAAASAGLMALAYTRVRPTFDAFCVIRVEQNDPGIFAKSGASPADFSYYLETQVASVTSPVVVETALAAHPELNDLPMLRGSQDPGADIRQNVKVANVPRTTLIRVDLSSNEPGETAEIVNAVVEAYLKHALDSFDSTTQKQIERFKDLRTEQLAKVNAQRDRITALTRSLGAASNESVRDRNVATIEAYRRLNDALTDVEIKHIAARARLDRLRAESGGGRGLDRKAFDDEVTRLFYLDPDVRVLQRDRDRAERDLRAAERATRSRSDPTVVRLNQRVADLSGTINGYWARLEPTIRRNLAGAQVDAHAERLAADAENELTALKTQEDALRSKLDRIKIENKNTEGEGLKLAFLQKDLEQATGLLDRIQENLNQLQFEHKSPVARVSVESRAKPSSRPNSDRRNQATAAAPLAVGLAVAGLLLLLERRGGRVGDPDELASRMNLQVIGVVPPLPAARAALDGPATASGLRAQRQLDEFVQSLDHLRVALCARKDPWGRDKHCVLITSACGSEGKTTLAAQLAERCVNAGLMTLLIDADLRNPTLSRMLDAADGPGLINVLRGEALAEDVVTVVEDAGGFHLLPAGGPKGDPSRLLQGDRLGRLVAQARESFDMILIDAPPVLPVPDALTIGRWADGAVLAVRYDASRFPLVERARRRLAHVGVPVLGAVVNGVRSMGSAYGGYYAYGGPGGYGAAAAATGPDRTEPAAVPSASAD